MERNLFLNTCVRGRPVLFIIIPMGLQPYMNRSFPTFSTISPKYLFKICETTLPSCRDILLGVGVVMVV